MAWWNPIDWIESGVEQVNDWFGWDEPGDDFGGGSQGYVGTSTAINGQQIEQYNHTMNGTQPVGKTNGIDWGDIANTAVQIGYNEYVRNKQNDFNEEEAEKQRAYEERLSNTSYQRAVADMQKAGINPAVAFGGGGGGASTPSGSAATASTSNGMDRASLANARTQRNLANMQIRNQTALTSADVANKNAQTLKTLKEAGYTEEKIKTATQERNLIIQQIKNAKTQNEKDKAEKELIEWEARNPIWSKILPATAGATGAVLGAIAAGPVGAGIGFGIGHGFRKPNKIGFNR